MRKKVHYFKLLIIFLLSIFIFSSCEFPYVDFYNTFKNKGVNFDNFLIINDKMNFRKIKNGLKVKPLESNYGDLTTFSFVDNYNSISLVLDKKNNLYSKSYENNEPLNFTSSYDSFRFLRQDMTLSEVKDTLGSEGTLTKKVYKDYNNEKVGTTYLWGISDTGKTIKCAFNNDDKIYNANYYDAINEEIGDDNPVFISNGYEKLNDIPLGSTISEAELILGSKAFLYSMGNLNKDTSSSYYKFKARGSSSNVFDIDISTDDRGKITKKVLYFGQNFKFNTTAKNLLAYADSVKEGMTYNEVKDLMGGDGLLYLSETLSQLKFDLVQPQLLMQYVSSIKNPSVRCNDLTGYENDYNGYVENYDWYRSNFQIDVKFVNGKVVSVANSHVFNNGYYDNEYLSNNGKGSLAESMQIDDTIKQTAISLTSNLETDRDKVYAIYDFVKNHITYDYSIFSDYKAPANYPEGSIPGAKFGYYMGRGVCFEYSCLFGAMLLEVGIYTRLMDNSDNANGSHMWNQFYDSDTNTWIPVDCTWSIFDFNEEDIEYHRGPNIIIEYSNFK